MIDDELVHVHSESHDGERYEDLLESEHTFELSNINISAASVANERLFNFLSGGVPNVGAHAIWQVSHEVGVPGGYVDVRIELYQTTALGMGNAIFNLMYDPAVLTPAEAFVSTLPRFDHSRLTIMQQLFYNQMREWGMSDEEIWEEFPHAIVNDASNLDAMEVVFHQPLFHPGHIHGAHMINVNWETGIPGGFFGSGLFMHVRFRILPGVSAGSVGYIKFQPLADGQGTVMTGFPPVGHPVRVPVVFEDGSVTVQHNLEVNNLPAFSVRPEGQTPTQMAVGAVSLLQGTPVGDYTFLGWVRGDVLPDLYADIAEFSGVMFPAGHIANVPALGRVVYTAIWGNQNSIVGVPNDHMLTISNVPAHPVTGTPVAVPGQTPSGTHHAGDVVNLTPGNRSSDNLDFLGWWVGTTGIPAPGANVNNPEIAGSINFLSAQDAPHTFTMQRSAETITALWGYEDSGLIGGEYGKEIRNVPEVTANGQTPTNNNILAGTNVSLVEGVLEAAYDYEFFGWIRGNLVPGVGDNMAQWLIDHPGVTLHHPTRPDFLMPHYSIRYTAIWGNHGIVGGPSHQAIFHFYGRSSMDSVIVPITIGESISMSSVAAAMTMLEDRYELMSGYAFWGWFEDRALSASGRQRPLGSTSITMGLRRPTVGSDGFDFSQVISQTLFDALAQNGTIHFYSVWALWGDVNDDDDVDGIDLELLRQFVRGVPNVDIVEAAAKVARNADVSGLDLELLRQYVRGVSGIILGRLN